jgi:hypothetical protein
MSTSRLTNKLETLKVKETRLLAESESAYRVAHEAKRLAASCITNTFQVKEHKEAAIKAVTSTCFDHKEVILDTVLSADGQFVNGLCFKVKEDGVEVPLHKEGAGVQSGVSYTMDMLNTAFSNSKAKLKILDEPFIHIAKDRIQSFAPTYISIAKDLGIQTVIVTHENFFAKNKIKLTKINNEVTVTYGKE